jgi:hypothetical protein
MGVDPDLTEHIMYALNKIIERRGAVKIRLTKRQLDSVI